MPDELPPAPDATDATFLPIERVDAAPPFTDRRSSRVDDASDMDDALAIDPRELDARVRIDEGGTVDADTPVAGVRYDTPEAPPHSYGQPDDAYGPGHGDGRIGFDRVSDDPAAGPQ